MKVHKLQCDAELSQSIQIRSSIALFRGNLDIWQILADDQFLSLTLFV